MHQLMVSSLTPKMTRSQVPSSTQNGPKLLKQWNCEKLEACFQLLALKGVEGRAKVPGWD